MTTINNEKCLDTLCQRMIDVKDPVAIECFQEVVNLYENLHVEKEALSEKNRNLNNEINELKGEMGIPNFKREGGNKGKDESTESERRQAEKTEHETASYGYKLNKSSIQKLLENDIPSDSLEKLNKLKGDYDNKEKFLSDVELLIGKSNFKKYHDNILKHATYQKRNRSSKIAKIEITKKVFCPVDKDVLPDDAYLISHTEKTVQDITITTENTLFTREVFYSPSEGKTYPGKIDAAYHGEYGPNIISQIFTFKFLCGMSEPRILRYLLDSGVIISSSYISNQLIHSEDIKIFTKERDAIFKAGLRSCKFHQIDDTGCSVNGKNKYVQIICHPLYAVFYTTDRKDRLTIIDLFRLNKERCYQFNDEAFDLLKQMNVSTAIMGRLQQLTNDHSIYNEEEMEATLSKLFSDPLKGKNTRARIKEAGAIAHYHCDLDQPVIEVLIGDDAPQFKLITEKLSLCWVHDARHYKKLSPISPDNKKILDDFVTKYWEYYRKLLMFKTEPSEESATSLRLEFDVLFSTVTGYDQLNDRIMKSKAKMMQLLTVLDYPEIPLHNNSSENGARLEKRYQDVSFYTKNEAGTLAKDTMLSIVETCRRLGVNAREYILDRVTRTYAMPSLASLIKLRGENA
jgi:hypothetical protein